MRGCKLCDWLPALALCGVVLLVILDAGCSLVGSGSGGAEVRVPFPHRPHIEQAGMECGACHRRSESGAAVKPAPEVCAECHELSAGSPDAPKILALFRDSQPAGPFFTVLSGEIIFDHERHAGGLECAACHGEMAQSESLGAELRISMSQCMACHEDVGAANDCATCHREIRADRRPPSHGGPWLEVHGLDRRGSDLARCWLCHEERGCEACHLDVKPKDHTNQFRRRGHGLLASMDRARCQVCHQSDFCVRCHEDTRPSSHIGSFGSPRNRHCALCHLPVTADPSCSVCHAATPSHELAPSLPGNKAHETATDSDCRSCHTNLRHFDNGQSCRLCHK
ncbi:MAG: cytochrome c3 family protein [Planctomycetota bacterium]